MGLSAGTRIGPYEVVSTLGSGGMGEVYRARDPRLARDVAIKALPERLAADEERVARFRREANVLASLNHPQIAAIYGLEEVGAAQFLVLELVEGETLAQRLASGPLVLRDALVIAGQIASALEAAHEKGIVHRDLKPANVGLTSDARVKVLDFGLAKTLASTDAPDAAGLDMATVTAGTQLGAVLGTAAYMSPEQARGLPIDEQTDIWAFGCVLYEMVTGRRSFPGQTTSDAIAGILEREPDWQLVPASTPPRILWLLQRCLAKIPNQRLHDIADARIEIDEALSRPLEVARPPEPSSGSAPRTRERVAWTVAALCLAGLAGLFVYGRGERVDPAPAHVQTYSASVVLPEGIRLSSGQPSSRFTLSPDGRRLALVAVDSAGRSMLYVRPLDSRAAQPLGGTEGAQYPFWSPDSRFVAFFAQGKLRKVEAGGGDVSTICDAGFNASGTWNRNDVILFTPKGNSPLFRVSARSGAPVALTTLIEEAGEVQHSHPFFLPDDRHFLYFVIGSKGGRTVPRGVYVSALDANAPGKLLVENATNAKYANGHLVFLRAGTLLAQPFDTERLELRGEAVPLVDQVQATGPSASDATGAFTVSDTGVLAYQTGSRVISHLTWYDRKGARGQVARGPRRLHRRRHIAGRRKSGDQRHRSKPSARATSGYSTSAAASASASRSTRGMSSDRTGRSLAETASSSARSDAGAFTSSRSRRGAPAASRSCMKTSSGSSTRALRQMAAISFMSEAAASSAAATSGCSRASATARPHRSSRRRSRRVKGSFPPTAGGWRSCRTGPDVTRST